MFPDALNKELILSSYSQFSDFSKSASPLRSWMGVLSFLVLHLRGAGLLSSSSRGGLPGTTARPFSTQLLGVESMRTALGMVRMARENGSRSVLAQVIRVRLFDFRVLI